MARKDPAAKAEIEKLKRTAPEIWNHKVRSLRIRRVDWGEGADMEGVDTVAEMQRARASYQATVTTHQGVEERLVVHWFLESEFVAHFVTNHMMVVSDARDLWRRSVDNQEVLRRGEGAALRLSVQGAPMTIGTQGRTLTRGIASDTPIETAQQEQDAVQQMNALVAGGNVTAPDFAGVGGEVFRTGHSVGPVGNFVPLTFPSVAAQLVANAPAPRSLLPAPGAGVIPLGDLPDAGPAEWTPTKQRRGGKAKAKGKGKAKAKGKGKAKDGATGALLVARQTALSLISQTRKMYGLRNKHLGERLQACLDKLGTAHVPTNLVVEAIARYGSLVKDCMNTKDIVPQWTSGNCQAHLEQLQSDIEELGVIAKAVGQAETNARELLAHRKAEALKVNRLSSGLRDRTVKPYISAGLFKELARWLFAVGFARPEASGIDIDIHVHLLVVHLAQHLICHPHVVRLSESQSC